MRPIQPERGTPPGRRILQMALGLTLAFGFVLSSMTATPSAARAEGATITVAQAITTGSGTGAVVQGYVVGQPTATQTVVTSGFPNDYALAIADIAGETDTTDMLYVQIPSDQRASYGLKSIPSLMGDRIDVAGIVEAYFSHPGLKSVTSMTAAGTDPDPGGDPGAYYADAEGLQGAQLEAALHTIISEQTRLTYAQVWDALKMTDEDPNNTNNVILLYTGRSQSKSSNGGDVDQWNREHVWAKSHGDFGTATGPGTDVHHLRPTDVSVNSDRSNLDFDNGGVENTEAPGNYSDSDSWEPRDAVKGDVAHDLLYVGPLRGWRRFCRPRGQRPGEQWVRPEHGPAVRVVGLERAGPTQRLRQRRNDVIFESIQGNRNPFIDHPEWAQFIWAA